ncbi:MAG: hypothetical protein IPL78_24770 [Chloroflexi bacterium]|nr:hypothetical protein [Chloroflexota bacterium]
MVEPLIFSYDHQIWEQQRRNQWLTLWCLPLLLFSCIFFTPFLLGGITLVGGTRGRGLTLAILALIWFQYTKFRHRRNTKLLLEANAISYANEVFVSGKAASPTRIFYDKITRLDIAHDRQQRPVELHIQTRDHQLALSGFRNMPQLVSELTRRVPETCSITRHRAWFSSPPPVRLFFFFILCMLALILLGAGSAQEQFVTHILIAGMYVYLSFLELRKGWQNYIDPKRKRGEMPIAFVVGIVWLGILFLRIGTEPEEWSLSAYWKAPCRLGQRLTGETGCVDAFRHDERSFFLPDSETMVRQQLSSVIIAPPSAWVNSRTPQLPYDGDLEIYGLSANRQMLLARPNLDRDTFQVWNVGAPFLSRQFTLNDSFYEEEMAISANGAYIAISGNEALYIYDLLADQITHQWPHNGKKVPLTFTPEAGTLILFNERDQPVIVDMDTGAPQQVLPLPENMTVSHPRSLVGFFGDGRFSDGDV